jgi:hypothetical protein
MAFGVSLPLNIGSVSQTTGTIAATGTFQALFAVNTARQDGLIQNNGTAVMYIYPGGTAAAQSAGTAAGLRIAAAATMGLTFGVPNGAYLGPIAIAGTAGDVYVAVENSSTAAAASADPGGGDLVELENASGNWLFEDGSNIQWG